MCRLKNIHAPNKLNPGDLVGVNKDNYLILDTLPSEYDSRVKAMEVDEKPTEDYNHIGGLEKQIQELVEAIVLPMTHKERFQKLGVHPPKGVLLYGPPGTGKTLMARACATQTNATFLMLAGPQLVQVAVLAHTGNEYQDKITKSRSSLVSNEDLQRICEGFSKTAGQLANIIDLTNSRLPERQFPGYKMYTGVNSLRDLTGSSQQHNNMPNDEKSPPMSWKIRHKIAVGTVRGLHYLHKGCQRRIIHRDIKASNIFLTLDYEPQISDFRLAKWLPTELTHHSIHPIEGTLGYVISPVHLNLVLK